MIRGGIDKRDRLCALLPDLAGMFNEDCMMCVTDTERFIAYLPGRTIDIRARVGEQIPPPSMILKAIREKRQISGFTPAHVWGVPFQSTATPIVDDRGSVVGCVAVGLSKERETRLTEMSAGFASSLEGILGGASDMQSSFKSSRDASDMLALNAEKTLANADQTVKLLAQIRSIANSTNLLSLNAAVEAARAGAAGRSFGVVAEEVKRLSTNTTAVASDIEKLLGELRVAITGISELTHRNLDALIKQTNAIEAISASADKMKKTAEALH